MMTMMGRQESDSTKCAFYRFTKMNVSTLIVNLHLKLWMKKGKCQGEEEALVRFTALSDYDSFSVLELNEFLRSAFITFLTSWL